MTFFLVPILLHPKISLEKSSKTAEEGIVRPRKKAFLKVDACNMYVKRLKLY